MPKTDIKIELKIERFNKRLRKMRENATNKNPLTGKVAIVMHKDVMDHFKRETGPDIRWQALRLSTVKRRRKGSQEILQDTGRLRASIMLKNTKTTASVFTNLKYAKIHNEGGRTPHGVKIPQRKFLWISKDAMKLIGKMVGKFHIGER
jgi:phage virion morphogenesis protein